jgi:hypothetical protein
VAGRDSGSCITITHPAIHRLLCRHPTTVLSGYRFEWLLAVPYSENEPALRGHISQPWRAWNRMRRRNFARFQQKSSAGASTSGRTDGKARVCLCVWERASKCPTLKVIR